MRSKRLPTFLLFAAFLMSLSSSTVAAQTAGPVTEIWPKLSATIELWPKTRVQIWGEKQNSEDFDNNQVKFGALVSYRMRRILKQHEQIDEEDQHYLVLGAGYEYLRSVQNGTTKNEHRLIIQATPRYLAGAGVLLQDRNRVEFRVTNGDYDFRYRNKLTVQRGFKLKTWPITPYASGELFWDRNHHEWNQNQYAFGVQLPYKKRLMIDIYYLRQNCTTCSQDPMNVWGATLNLFFRRKK